MPFRTYGSRAAKRASRADGGERHQEEPDAERQELPARRPSAGCPTRMPPWGDHAAGVAEARGAIHAVDSLNDAARRRTLPADLAEGHPSLPLEVAAI